ncbi:Lrp/AsnC ligand binding domain-containing protein, partial [Listeria monocytogenes]|nr:Lrp/AsnC ligand binding domain-containing protein [Listeria monocytogenes]
PVTIFAEIAMEKLGRQDRLEKRLRSIEEVVECWEISGDLDYLARFVCRDVTRYQALTNSLIDDPELGVRRITSHIAMRPIC